LTSHEIIIEFEHPRFAALIPNKEDISIRDLLTDIWDYPSEVLSKARYNNLSPLDSRFSYDGSIAIEIMGFHIPEYEYEATRNVDVIDIPSYLIPLPTARIKAKLVLDNLNPVIVRTLQWYRKIIENFDEKTVYLEMVDPIASLLKALTEAPETVSDILSKFEGKEKWFRYLARKSKEDPTRHSVDVLLVDKSTDPLRIAYTLLSTLVAVTTDEIESSDEQIERLVDRTRSQLKSTEIPIDNESEAYQNYIKLRKSFLLQSVLSEVKKGSRKLPEGVDPTSVGEFANDLFNIVTGFWNNIVKYLKYEEAQYWVNEYPPHAAGLFFIRNRVTFDGEELLPHMTAHVRQQMIKYNQIDNAKWKRIVAATKDGNKLQELQMEWTVDGILSQALAHLTQNELTAAIVLSCVALEEALTRALYHIDPENYESGGLGAKLGKAKGKINRIELEYDEESWTKDFNLLTTNNKQTGKGLDDIRKRIQHPEVGLDKAIPSRAEVAARVLAAQRMCRALLKWARKHYE
jgi:hypothetical protein